MGRLKIKLLLLEETLLCEHLLEELIELLLGHDIQSTDGAPSVKG